MKPCLWKSCEGKIINGRCYKCARSGNLKYELYIERKQMEAYHNWKSYGTGYKTKSRKEKSNHGESGEESRREIGTES